MFHGPQPPIFVFASSLYTQNQAPLRSQPTSHLHASPPHVEAVEAAALSPLPGLFEMQNQELHLLACLHRSALLASHNRGGSPTGLPKNSQREEERQLDEAGTARGQMGEKAACRISLVAYLGKSCRQVPPPLWVFLPRRLLPPLRSVEHGLLFIYFQSWQGWLAFLCFPVRTLSRKQQLVSSEMSVRMLA